MHELSVASAIVTSVIDFAKKHQAHEVIEVTLEIGELTSVAKEQLKFCYEAVSKETVLEGSKITIEEVKAEVLCSHCSYRGAPKMWDEVFHFVPVPVLACPQCGQDAEVMKGKECTIINIKYRLSSLPLTQ